MYIFMNSTYKLQFERMRKKNHEGKSMIRR